MNKILICITLMLSASALKGDCEECKKLRDELTKSWQSSLKFSGEIRSLTDSVLKHSEAIRKMHGI